MRVANREEWQTRLGKPPILLSCVKYVLPSFESEQLWYEITGLEKAGADFLLNQQQQAFVEQATLAGVSVVEHYANHRALRGLPPEPPCWRSDEEGRTMLIRVAVT